MDILYFLVFLEPCNGTDIYGLCYWSILEKLTFLDANSKCGENNGTLAEIPNHNSNNFVSTNLWVTFVSSSKSLKRPTATIGGPSLVIIFYNESSVFSKTISFSWRCLPFWRTFLKIIQTKYRQICVGKVGIGYRWRINIKNDIPSWLFMACSIV